MTCTCKVFSTLILDSRYFYSRKKPNISSRCLMLRDSCLYSSLACSVYSICWVIFFFSLLVWNHMPIFIHHLTQLTPCDLFCWILSLYIFGGIHKGGEVKWICEKRNCLLGDSPSRAKAWMWPARSGRLLRSRHSSVTLTLPRPPQGCDF